MINWYPRQFILFVCLCLSPCRSNPLSSGGVVSQHSELYFSTNILRSLQCGRWAACYSVFLALSAFWRVYYLSSVFSFFPISNIVNLCCPAFNKPQSNNQHEYSNYLVIYSLYSLLHHDVTFPLSQIVSKIVEENISLVTDSGLSVRPSRIFFLLSQYPPS